MKGSAGLVEEEQRWGSTCRLARKRISCLSAPSADDVASWANASAATHSGGRLQIVAREGASIVLTTHYLEEA